MQGIAATSFLRSGPQIDRRRSALLVDQLVDHRSTAWSAKHANNRGRGSGGGVSNCSASKACHRRWALPIFRVAALDLLRPARRLPPLPRLAGAGAASIFSWRPRWSAKASKIALPNSEQQAGEQRARGIGRARAAAAPLPLAAALVAVRAPSPFCAARARRSARCADDCVASSRFECCCAPAAV